MKGLPHDPLVGLSRAGLEVGAKRGSCGAFIVVPDGCEFISAIRCCFMLGIIICLPPRTVHLSAVKNRVGIVVHVRSAETGPAGGAKLVPHPPATLLRGEPTDIQLVAKKLPKL